MYNFTSSSNVVLYSNLFLAAISIDTITSPRTSGYFVFISSSNNGKEMTSDNIDQLLTFRYESAKFRRAGGKLKGPKKRTEKNNISFEMKFRQICEHAIQARKEGDK